MSHFDTPPLEEALRIPSDLHSLPGSKLQVLNDALESRARLCFRSLSLLVATVVLVLTAYSLHEVTSAFVERARVAPLATSSKAGSPAVLGATPTLRPLLTPTPRELASDWPHAIVAVISILLVGEVVLAIGLIRATFALRVKSDGHTPPDREPPCAGTLPGVELLKAITDAFGTVLKGLPKR